MIIPLLLSILFLPACFLIVYNSAPIGNHNSAVAGIIEEIKCYPSGFKHDPYCMVKFDNYFFKYQFVDDTSDSKGVLYKAYYDKQCIFVEFHNSLILKIENCNGETISLIDNNDLTNLYKWRNRFIVVGIISFLVSIIFTFLLNQEYKKEKNQNSNKGLKNE